MILISFHSIVSISCLNLDGMRLCVFLCITSWCWKALKMFHSFTKCLLSVVRGFSHFWYSEQKICSYEKVTDKIYTCWHFKLWFLLELGLSCRLNKAEQWRWRFRPQRRRRNRRLCRKQRHSRIFARSESRKWKSSLCVMMQHDLKIWLHFIPSPLWLRMSKYFFSWTYRIR